MTIMMAPIPVVARYKARFPRALAACAMNLTAALWK